MRICLYTETALPKLGGQEMVVDALARQFQEHGHDVAVLAPQPRHALRVTDESLPYKVVRHPPFYSTRYFVPWYRWFLTRALRVQRTEVLHCHGLYPPGYLAGLARGAIPTVITSHGGDVHVDNVRLAKPLVKRRIREGLAAADALVAISRFTKQGMRALCQGANIVSIPNGVDLSPYERQAARPKNLPEAVRPKGYFLFLGRLKYRKGVDVLLHALARVTAGVPLVVAGAGEERPALEQLGARLGINERVWYVGAVQHPDKAYLLQNALAVVVPTRIWEAFGLVVLESFAAGTPVIGTRLPGLEDLIGAGQTGWLVEPENAGGLASALQEAWDGRGHSAAMGMEARRQAQRYSWRAIAHRHLELYERLRVLRRLVA